MIIRILIHKDKLILSIADSINEFLLSQFGYDYNKPIKENENHFINKDLIKKVKTLIKPNRTIISSLFQRDNIFVGIDSTTDSVAVRHHSDFAELVGINNPKIVIKAIDDFENQDLNDIINHLDSEKYSVFKEVNRLHF
jgi:hypothetical protein